jgi:hypothetical protein
LGVAPGDTEIASVGIIEYCTLIEIAQTPESEWRATRSSLKQKARPNDRWFGKKRMQIRMRVWRTTDSFCRVILRFIDGV